MKCKRLLTLGLMALSCIGTAAAVSKLNSVQVTPNANTATVNLRTTGSYAHKEYRPDEHLVLVDLTGVSADAAIKRSLDLSSVALKGYKLSNYTSASGTDVTRIELTVGDKVSVNVSDVSDGLQILLTSGGTAGTTSSNTQSSAVLTMPSAPRPAQTEPVKRTFPDPVVPSPKYAVERQPSQPKVPDGSLTARSNEPAVTIRNISVQRGHGTVDVVIEGPTAAHPFLLSGPDRLVLDFSNAVVKSSVKNIAVHTKDVLQVRVGRFQAEPPVTRIVIDLGGPRTFDVIPSANQVIVRVKVEESEVQPTAPLPLKVEPVAVKIPAPAPAPVLASVEAPPPVMKTTSFSTQVQPEVNSALASAASTPAPSHVSIPAASSTPSKFPVHEQQIADPKVRAGIAADTLIPALPNASAMTQARVTSPNTATSQGTQNTASPSAPGTPKYTGEPISVNLKDVDLKDFFRLIHEISGLNIVLDPSVHGTLTLVLDDVPWDQALDIVLKNNALDRELQGNVLRIAATDTLRREAVDRRAQSEAVALAVDRETITRFLSYAKAKEVVPTIKKFLTARGDVIADERTNALIISDIPSVLPNLDRMIAQLDKKTQEVEIEVRVVSATRSFSRDLGVQLGFSWGNGVSTIGGTNPGTTTSSGSSSGSSSSSSSSSSSNGTNSSIPLFSNFPATGATTGFSISNLTKSYGIDAILTAAENHNLAKVLSRPRVVTQSNVKAEVKQGVKLPVTTSSTNNSLATVTYIDSVLRLSVTPQITADNTIFMNVDVENTQPTGTANSDGNYILTTQQATTQVLVSDGGTVVIGGVIQTTNSVSTTQTPVLGSIPWLGNLFKERFVKTETDELIFFITPKIIQT